MSDNIERLLHEMRERAKEYGKAKELATYLELYKRPMRAKLMEQAEKQGVTAIGKMEIYAHAHPDYEAHIAALAAATGDEANLKMRFETAKLQVDVWRSKCSQRKFEFNANGN